MSQHRHTRSVPARLRAVVITAIALITVGFLAAGCASSRTDRHLSSGAPAHTATGQPAGGGGRHTTASPSRVPATTQHVFAPFDRTGAPMSGVAAHRSGSCFTRSITVAARDAYRCFAANTILDPCFVSPKAPQHLLDCYLDPWSRAIQVRVAKLPASTSVIHVTRPWAIELTGGIRCVVTNGTLTILHGVALGYRCPDGWAGLPKTSAPTVSAVYQASDGAVQRLSVRTEWRATA